MSLFVLKRLFDASIALCLLVLLAPVLLVAAIGIKLTSRGPVVYRARRVGRDRRSERRPEPYRGREFTMYKLRTMRDDTDSAVAPITALHDSRVFPWGRVLRALKIDEVPQLVNVLKGDMSLVGPRPEAPEVVSSHYGPDDVMTLRALPGMTSPGTLYYYTHCEPMLAGDVLMDVYVGRVLPAKLAIDRVYLAKASVLYDIRVILRTVGVVVARSLGARRFGDPPEMRQAGVSSPG